MMRHLIVFLILTTSPCAARGDISAYTLSPDSIHKHIAVLASDSLEGREVGEPGEWKAARYIISILEPLGLEPKGDDGSYLQAFDFTKRIDLGPANRLIVNNEALEVGEGFTPLLHSAATAFDFDDIVDVGFGIVSEDSAYDDYAGKDVDGRAVLIKRYSPDSTDETDTVPRHNAALEKYSALTDKIVTALDHNVSGIFFYTPENYDDTLISLRGTHIQPKDVPIIFLRRKGLRNLGLDLSAPRITSAEGETDLIPVRDTGYNVVSYLPGQTDTTIVIGAHYDHLGWGGPSSRYLGKDKKIHYGADDNGSGTAALLELARHFASRRGSLHYSMLFINFSGEEAGLLGSSYYVRHWTIDRDKVYMMLNMDMIGRLREEGKGLVVMGTGTCTEFESYFDSFDGDMKISPSKSGSGPSDHTAFYHDSIPTLSFFTGAHQDYHTPTDVVEGVDCEGVVKVAVTIAGLVDYFDDRRSELVFHRTKDDSEGRHRASFSVTLGIMPDFISEVQGLRIDGVSPDRPADRAGMLKGDIIIGMGGRTIGDIYDYMNLLGKFRKGDSTDAVLVRGSDTLTMGVEFK